MEEYRYTVKLMIIVSLQIADFKCDERGESGDGDLRDSAGRGKK